MRIGQFNTHPHGGAFIAAARFHDELVAQGVDSRFYYRIAHRPAPEHGSYQPLSFASPSRWQKLNPWNKENEHLRRRRVHDLFDLHLSGRPVPGDNFTMAELADPTRLDWNGLGIDIVHLHWIAHLADYPSFFHSIPRGTPIFWTLHDMFPVTGGCHYSAGCSHFSSGCGDCPLVLNRHPDDVSAESFQAKRKALQGHRLQVIAPSQWLLDLARQSPIWPETTEFRLVRYGLDLQQFKPHGKAAARAALGLGSEALLIGFGADNLTDARKGLPDLLNALELLSPDLNVEAILFGSGKLEVLPASLKHVHQFGFVSDPERQALLYSACDLVIVPSREDNQPSVGLEALACGTPVVATRAGGIPEYVHHGVNGLLAEPADPQDLHRQIDWMLRHPDARQVMAQRGRMQVQREFEITRQTGLYRQLYAASLAGATASANRRRAA
ncbi:MAG: glycosyltransferase [Planctomycetota bacterium]